MFIVVIWCTVGILFLAFHMVFIMKINQQLSLPAGSFLPGFIFQFTHSSITQLYLDQTQLPKRIVPMNLEKKKSNYFKLYFYLQYLFNSNTNLSIVLQIHFPKVFVPQNKINVSHLHICPTNSYHNLQYFQKLYTPGGVSQNTSLPKGIPVAGVNCQLYGKLNTVFSGDCKSVT